MTPTRVAIVTTYFRPVLGGAEAAAERLAVFLHRRGHAVVVLTKRTSTTQPRVERVDGLDIERLGPIGERSGRGKWAVMPAVFQALLRRGRDVDVVCCVDYRGIGIAALAARSVTGRPVIFQAQTEGVISAERVRAWLGRVGMGRDGVVARVVTWPVRALYGRADAIGCISRGIEREVIDAGVARDRVHYLPNPVDTRLFSPGTADGRRDLRAQFGVRDGDVLAVFVGRLSREKGVIELLRAWRQARPAATLAVIGPSMTNHPWDVAAEAHAFVEGEGLRESVRFLGGQPMATVASWLRAADFAVQPSHFEAMGLAAAEAMASGLPVIASDTGGYRDFVVHEENGLLVPPRDIAALAASISRLAGDATLREVMGRRARAAAERFDEAVVLEEFASLIDRLAAR